MGSNVFMSSARRRRRRRRTPRTTKFPGGPACTHAHTHTKQHETLKRLEGARARQPDLFGIGEGMGDGGGLGGGTVVRVFDVRVFFRVC